MPIDNSKIFEEVILDCGKEFRRAVESGNKYKNSWWDKKIIGIYKYNMFGVRVLPGIFRWIIATKWAENSVTTDDQGGTFARGAPVDKGLSIFEAFFPFPVQSRYEGEINSTLYERNLGFYEKTVHQRKYKDTPEMNLEWKIVSKRKKGNYPEMSFIMNVHVTCTTDLVSTIPSLVVTDTGGVTTAK